MGIENIKMCCMYFQTKCSIPPTLIKKKKQKMKQNKNKNKTKKPAEQLGRSNDLRLELRLDKKLDNLFNQTDISNDICISNGHFVGHLVKFLHLTYSCH